MVSSVRVETPRLGLKAVFAILISDYLITSSFEFVNKNRPKAGLKYCSLGNNDFMHYFMKVAFF